MRNQRWERIIYDYQNSTFPRKNELVEMFKMEVHGLDSLNFENGIDQTIDSLLKVIEGSRRMYEENKVEEKRIDFWSIHIQSITMLENVLLIEGLKQ